LKAAKLAITCRVSLQNIAVAGDRSCECSQVASGVLGGMLSGRGTTQFGVVKHSLPAMGIL
jgi:hypothetical protein